jgi:hypothetical protein
MAIKPFNSVGGFSVGEVPANVILANGDITTGNANLTANLYVTNTANVGNLRTDNLLYANGNPWDLQEAAGGNTQIQYNLGNNFAASANFTYDDSIQILTVLGNANITKTLFGNVANFSGNLTSLNASLGNLATANYVNVSQQINGNVANFSGNITSLNANLGNLATANFVNVSSNLQVTDTANVGNLRTNNLLYANGQPWDLQEAAGANTQLQFNDGNNNFGASANLVFDFSTNVLTVTGNANVTGTTETANAKVSTISNTQVVYANANSFLIGSANYTFDDVASNLTVVGNVIATSFFGNISGNIQAPGANTEILFNDANITNAVANFSYDKAFNSGGGQLDVGNTVGGHIITDNVYASYGNIGNLDVTTDIVAGGNISTTGSGGDITMSGGNISGVNNISANTANFAGNVTAANIVGALANGTSNVKVYSNANVEITVAGSANTATFSSTGLYVVGEINTTSGNMLSNGNISANLFLNSANANVTGEAVLGSVKTANITAPTGTITISAAGANNNIILSPSGVGNVDVGLHNITQVALPVNPNDAATKEYVDSTAQGLQIHTAANVTTKTNLASTYDNGGTVLSVTTIAGGKTITFSGNHGLAVDDNITFTNSFNGIIGGEAYFVFSAPTLTEITIKDGYFGAEVTTLTNASGLTEPALGNGGVGATLTNSGAQVALTIDSVLMTVGARVLVQGQTNQFENGIYEVTTVGTVSTNWVLTRSSDGDSYQPNSDTALNAGSYFFTSQGSQNAGSSYVLTAPSGEIIIGVDSIVFSQFSAAGSYSPGNGIAITGTIISANVDNDTTAISGGNIVVKTGANLTTPNIGDATFSSITWNTLSNGNVTANNLSIGNIANITGNLRVDGIIESNGNVTSNAFINGNNASFTNFANIGGNLLANNITSNNDFSTNTANISSNLVTSNATVNLELSGNTANFSGNVIVNNLTVNLELAGNTANFTGNITSLNANLGNLATANFVNVSSNTTTNNLTVNLQLDGNTANFTGNITTLNANLGNLATANFVNVSSNTTTNNLTVNLQLDGNTANFTGNITTLNANLGNLVTANYGNFANDVVVQGNIANANNISVTNLINGNTANFSGNIVAPTFSANTSVLVGDTTITHGNVTTTAVTANQTIASFSVTGVTGVEYIVKGIDSGGKYSVATVLAVTDGTNADYTVYGSTQLGGYTGSLAVNISGSFIRLQVTPASSNSTVWTTQYRLI